MKNGKKLPSFSSSLMNPQQLATQKQFLEIYEAFHNELFRFVLGQTRNRDASLDILQETFTKTWDYLRSGKKIDQSRGFLYKTCRNLIIDYRRKKKPVSLDVFLENESSVDFEEPDTDQANLYDPIEKEYLMQILHEIPDHHFEILQLRYIQELTLSEIAAILKESENSVSVKIHRALKFTRSHFEKNNPSIV